MSADVNFICKIDRELYRVVEQELLTELYAAYENLDYEKGSELLSGWML